MADIEIEQKGDVNWIRLNRPERMNAYDGDMARELIAAIENAADSGVIVLTGTGRAFCAVDTLPISRIQTPQPFARCFTARLHVYEAIRNSPRPVIAAVNGAAAGGGNELVVACDLAIARIRQRWVKPASASAALRYWAAPTSWQ